MQGLKLSAVLAARDWFYEYSLSLCAVLALASMLMPLLILQGVKDGKIDIDRATAVCAVSQQLINTVKAESDFGHRTGLAVSSSMIEVKSAPPPLTIPPAEPARTQSAEPVTIERRANGAMIERRANGTMIERQGHITRHTAK